MYPQYKQYLIHIFFQNIVVKNLGVTDSFEKMVMDLSTSETFSVKILRTTSLRLTSKRK